MGGTIVNASVGWALAEGIFAMTVFGWVYFHNYSERDSRVSAQIAAYAVGMAVVLAFPFKGVTTENPLRWLGACIIEGTCGARGSWIYPVGPAIGIFVGYLLHLITSYQQPA